MKFAELAGYLEKLEKTSSRNEITQILSEAFKKAQADEIDKVVYLLSGRLAPSYSGIEYNLAERMMERILAKAYGEETAEVAKMFKNLGDLGEVAAKLATGRGGNLSVNEVFSKMLEIASEAGTGSQEAKVDMMAKLFSELDPLSSRFVARIPTGNLRLGFSDMTILDALSVMVKGDKSARKEIEAAYNVMVDIGRIAKLVKEKGISGLGSANPEPGAPVRPSLAERLPTAEKILEKVGNKVAVEPKYDGFRCQVHIYKEDGEKKVQIFSRNLENTTQMFPDLVEAAKKLRVETAIFDSEAIGFDTKTGKFLPFQETVQRKRKHGIEEAAKKFPLKLFVFDILYLNGKPLLARPFSERRKELEKVLSGDHGAVELTHQDIVSDPNQIRDLVKKYLSEGLEGAMVKKIDSEYKAGARGYHWVKYKKHTDAGVADTIDCLVMGIYKGKGKRTGFGAGAFLVGIKSGAEFKSVSKIGTGLTDEQWRELDKRARKLEVSQEPKEYEVPKTLVPDAWTKPSLVVEILADEITKSPIHSAGLALRFPRLIKFRDEKNPEQTTTLSEVEGLFKMQKVAS